ncbi:MAG: tRNA lysidine(34) synthetase TilS [Bacilli bacterium]|nr:tRNA lysidine(34) synthetase TilS [Bacilli bacterium]
MNNVYKFIENLKINNQCIVVAVSGGPDSMFLLDTLIKSRDKLNLKIVVAHVNHNIRPESYNEAIEVEKYCKNNNLIFESYKIEKYPDDKFSEEAARKIRYEFFEKVINKYNSDILFTAHHGDDLIETVLMRLTRGSSIKGYAGFESVSKDRGYKVAKPLIFMTKEEIVNYLDENNIWYAIDMSNTKDDYTRNRYRKYILPELKKENKDVHNKFLEYNQKLLMADEYLKKVAADFYNKNVVDNKINIHKFNELDKIIKVYVLEKYLKGIYLNNIGKINNTHIDIIINLLSNSNNSIIDLPLNKKGIIEYNNFRIIDNKYVDNYEYIFTNSVELPNGKKIYVDNFTKDGSNYVIHINSEEIKLPFHVRTRKDGDLMCIKNMNGSKKVNDIFTDFKLSKELRDSYPIVTDDSGEIIWIPGIKKSHLDRKKEQKYDIILKYE